MYGNENDVKKYLNNNTVDFDKTSLLKMSMLQLFNYIKIKKLILKDNLITKQNNEIEMIFSNTLEGNLLTIGSISLSMNLYLSEDIKIPIIQKEEIERHKKQLIINNQNLLISLKNEIQENIIIFNKKNNTNVRIKLEIPCLYDNEEIIEKMIELIDIKLPKGELIDSKSRKEIIKELSVDYKLKQLKQRLILKKYPKISQLKQTELLENKNYILLFDSFLEILSNNEEFKTVKRLLNSFLFYILNATYIPQKEWLSKYKELQKEYYKNTKIRRLKFIYKSEQEKFN